jgi:hypothetical protein
MAVKRWVTSFEFAWRLGVRETKFRLPPGLTEAQKLEEKHIMDAFYKRVERGTLPPPDARTDSDEMKWFEATIDAYMERCEQTAKVRAQRKVGRPLGSTKQRKLEALHERG